MQSAYQEDREQGGREVTVMKMVPIYRTDGEWVAVYYQGHVFDIDGEWIGFVAGREVFAPNGHYIGFLSDDQRLLCKRSLSSEPPHREPPPAPERPAIPARMPLAPMLRELPQQIIDVFLEFPERLAYVSDTRPDME